MGLVGKIRRMGGLLVNQLTAPGAACFNHFRRCPNIRDMEAHLTPFVLPPGNAESATLDIGCGDIPRNPFGASGLHGVDIRAFPEHNVVACDLVTSPLPFEDGRSIAPLRSTSSSMCRAMC